MYYFIVNEHAAAGSVLETKGRSEVEKIYNKQKDFFLARLAIILFEEEKAKLKKEDSEKYDIIQNIQVQGLDSLGSFKFFLDTVYHKWAIPFKNAFNAIFTKSIISKFKMESITSAEIRALMVSSRKHKMLFSISNALESYFQQLNIHETVGIAFLIDSCISCFVNFIENEMMKDQGLKSLENFQEYLKPSKYTTFSSLIESKLVPVEILEEWSDNAKGEYKANSVATNLAAATEFKKLTEDKNSALLIRYAAAKKASVIETISAIECAWEVFNSIYEARMTLSSFGVSYSVIGFMQKRINDDEYEYHLFGKFDETDNFHEVFDKVLDFSKNNISEDDMEFIAKDAIDALADILRYQKGYEDKLIMHNAVIDFQFTENQENILFKNLFTKRENSFKKNDIFLK